MTRKQRISQRVRPCGRAQVLVVCAALVCSGCGARRDWKPVYPVRGQVLYQGKPAGAARVVLHPAEGAYTTY
jgi:hypothetical protein